MGILVNAAYLMLIEGKREPFKGHVLQLGRQSILFSYVALQSLAETVGFHLTSIDIPDVNAHMSDEQFFKSLGFDAVFSMEFGTAESATYVWDLNNPTPFDWDEKFDFIYDGGTVEHIFHVPNAIASICRMVKLGGRVVHEAGVSGAIDHGFYAIQPTFFHDFYAVNGFRTDLATVSKIELAKWLTHTGTQAEYVAGQYDYFKCFAMSAEHIYCVLYFVTKIQPFHDMVVPQQSIWSRGQ